MEKSRLGLFSPDIIKLSTLIYNDKVAKVSNVISRITTTAFQSKAILS